MENFQAVAAMLGSETEVKWCAGPEEALEGAIRFDDLYELACWLARARLYIGNDSGIGHLAAAVGVPVVSIFLSTDPLVWAPRGSHVRVLEKPSPGDVYRAARSLLGLSVGRWGR
ncbi:MAG: glycosyltransferase family 9 protein [Acidobacteriota bacterium]